MTNQGTAGRYIYRNWRVVHQNRVGVCFKETLWGNNQVRWIWLRFPTGEEKAFAPSEVMPAL